MVVNASALSTAFSSAISRTTSTPRLSEPLPVGVATDRNPAISAEEMALSYAGLAESSIGAINQSIQNREFFKSEEAQQRINSQEVKDHIERVRQMYGDEAAEKSWARMQPDVWAEKEEQSIENFAGNIRGHFNVSGSLYNYDKQTDSYSPGTFSLSVDAGYFAVKVDSATGVQISTEGKPFTHDFVRNYIPNAEFLRGIA